LLGLAHSASKTRVNALLLRSTQPTTPAKAALYSGGSILYSRRHRRRAGAA
jgi:hypothetical protein